MFVCASRVIFYGSRTTRPILLRNRIFQHQQYLVKNIQSRTITHGSSLLSQERKYNSQISIRNEDPENRSPLVFIFGWGNGSRKNLMKYSELFEKKDHTTVLITTTLMNSLFRTSTKGRQESENVKKLLCEMLEKNKKRKVLLYSFSNGGCAIFHMMTESMDSSTFPGRNIRGQIFDSCPVVPNARSALAVGKAFSELFKNTLAKRLSATFAEMMAYFVINVNKEVKEFMSNMENSKVTCPQLFLFSKDDELAPFEDIQSFIKERNKRGICTQHILWETSQHCSHLKNHPEEYYDVVEEFIASTLESNGK